MRRRLAAAALALASAPFAHALGTGDLAFTSINADEDGWSVVSFVDIAAGTTLYFTDNEWNGSAFNSGESFHQWTSGASAIAAGTVIRFSKIDSASGLGASVGTLARASVSGSINYGLSQTEDTLYMYQAASATATPSVFLGAISTTAFGTASAGVLANTGLAVGAGAVALGGGADFDEYVGPRSGLASWADYKALVADRAQWTHNAVDGSYADRAPSATAFAVTPMPEPGSGALLLAGLGAMGFIARRLKGDF